MSLIYTNLLKIIGILLLIVPIAYAADLKTSNTYYAGNDAVSENLEIRNMDYTGAVDIYMNDLLSTFECQHDSDKSGVLDQRILFDNKGSGSTLQANGPDLGMKGFFVAGTASGAKVSFNFNSGRARATYYNPITFVKENIIASGCNYQSVFGVTPQSLFSIGTGSSRGHEAGGFEYDINVKHAGKLCQIESFLSSDQEKSSVDYPMEYFWNSFANSNGRTADFGINLKASEGNRDADFQIKGTSSELTDKYSPLNGNPAHLDKVQATSPFYSLRITKYLNMTYEII